LRGGVFANSMGDVICIVLAAGIINSPNNATTTLYRNEHNCFRIFIKIDLNHSNKMILG
jgi:hypothetical protein